MLTGGSGILSELRRMCRRYFLRGTENVFLSPPAFRVGCEGFSLTDITLPIARSTSANAHCLDLSRCRRPKILLVLENGK